MDKQQHKHNKERSGLENKSFLRSAPLIALETAINTAVKYDTYTQKDLLEFDNKVVGVKTMSVAGDFFILFRGGQVEIYDECEAEIDASIEGTPFTLLRLLLSTDSFMGSGVVVCGDQNLIAELKSLAGKLDVDWEELLSRYLGDGLSHRLGGFARNSFSWLTKAANTLVRDTSEFMQEESRIVPGVYETRDFVNGVEELRKDFDHLETRFFRLQKNLRNRDNKGK